jgi:hypothetical protein
VTGVALLGGCGSPAGKASSGSSPAKPVPAGQPDPVRDRALAAEADLLARYDATLALPSVVADSALTAKLTAIRAEHAAHVTAIKQGYTPPSKPTPSSGSATPAPSPSTPGATTWSPSATTDAKTAVSVLAGAEQDAAGARTTDILAADGATAMLLASIAASESGHAALLLGGSA